MSTPQLIVLIAILSIVICQVQSSIICKRGDQEVTSENPVHYREGDQSIIVCEDAAFVLELLAGESKAGIVRRSDDNHHLLGIWLKHVGSRVQMSGVSTGQGGTDNAETSLNLDFIVEAGDPPTSCKMNKTQIVSRDNQVQCMLNDEPFGENTAIFLNEECRQSNVVVCTMPYNGSVEHFGPGHGSGLTTWIPVEKNSTHHIAILRMEDIHTDSTMDVSMHVLVGVNTLPSPFTFKIVNQPTDLGGGYDLTTTVSPSDYTSIGTTPEENPASPGLDESDGQSGPLSDNSVVVGASVGSVTLFIGAVAVVAAVVIPIVVLVICKRTANKKNQGVADSSTVGVLPEDKV